MTAGDERRAQVSSLTLYRERTQVFDPGAADARVPIMTLRSNRAPFQIERAGGPEHFVVRGQAMSGTLRLSALAIERAGFGPLLANSVSQDWEAMWATKVSAYERQFREESWVALYDGGRRIFSTLESPLLDLIEKQALGADVTERLLKGVTGSITGRGEQLVVRHDSQTAVVFTVYPKQIRVAVLERFSGRTRSFAVTVNQDDAGQPGIALVAAFIADMVESLELGFFLSQVKGGIANRAVLTAPPAQVAAAMARRRDLAAFLDAFERANRLTYRPERPSGLNVSAAGG